MYIFEERCTTAPLPTIAATIARDVLEERKEEKNGHKQKLGKSIELDYM